MIWWAAKQVFVYLTIKLLTMFVFFFGHWFLIIFLITHLVPLFSNRRQILYSYYHQNWAAHTNLTVTTGCNNLILGWTFPLLLALRVSISAYSCTLTHLRLTLLLTPPEKNLKKKQKPNHKTMMTPVTSLWHNDCYLTPWRSREDILQLFFEKTELCDGIYSLFDCWVQC